MTTATAPRPPALLFAPLLALLLSAPASARSADCPDGAFDAFEGGWVGQQYTVGADGSRTFVGTTVWTVAPILGGCATLERVFVHGADGEHVFTARLLRSWNAEAARWDLTEADDRGSTLRFRGRRGPTGGWGFEIPRERDGRPWIQRLVWERVADDHVRERFERSFDGGETFELYGTIDFHRSPGLVDAAL